MMTPTTSREHVPQALADRLDEALQGIENDCEVCRLIATARDGLRALSWARFKQRHEHNDKVARLRRLHRGYHRFAAPQQGEERSA